MEPIVQKLREYRDRRREKAQLKYSRILLRFDHPKPKDARTLNAVMKQLSIDEHELESDILLIHQYRCYLGRKSDSNPNVRGCRDDAENIRRMHPRLFLAMQKKPKSQDEPSRDEPSRDEPSRGGGTEAKDHSSSAP